MARRALQLLALAATMQDVECLELSNRQLTNITSNGSSFAFYSDSELITTVSASALSQESRLQLQDNSLNSIPATLFQAAYNVTSIDISNNPLTKLDAGSFVNMPNLQSILCSNTNVTVLPNSLVSNCPLLSIMSFNHSAIGEIEPQALVNLTALHTLDVSHNELESIPSALFTVSSSWKSLDFSHNGIMEVPSGIRNAIAEGYISLDYNALVEIEEGAFADAKISELRLASNAIYTLNSKAFAGMSTLRKLNLSDNVISVIDEDAFADVNGLQELRLDSNNIHRLTLSSVPTSLERLELQNNLMDLMPDFPDDFEASHLVHLNLSRNYLWSISTNDALTPYTGLVTLDLSNNRLVSFSAAVFDPIMSTIESMNFDSNLITSIPSTNFIALVKELLTNVTLLNNPGIGWFADVDMRNDCPKGSVFEELTLSSGSGSAGSVDLYGCIQCVAGTFHDNSTGSCVACTEVSSRAYSEEDGATVCLYCPYSSDLEPDRTECRDFECNTLCWLTLSMGIAIPGIIFSSKFLLYLIMKSSKRTRRMDIKEQEAMNDWRMGLMMHQLAEPISPSDSLLDDEIDEEASGRGEMPVRIYDLPEETKDLVLSTLRDYFQIRKEKRWQALPADEQEATSEWQDVEWETFHMHRILSRSYHGEVFLGDYCGTQVVVKRMMTLRFEVKELADTIKNVELLGSLHHPNIVTCLGTMWSDPEHLCVISEYVKGGDLTAVLEVDGLDRPNRNNSSLSRISTSSAGDDTDSKWSLLAAIGMSKASLMTRFQMALDICKALLYMHSKGISHSDLRSRNVMVTEMFRCKIGDARHHSRDDTHHATHVLLVESPEVQSSDSEEEGEGVRFLQPERRDLQQDKGPTLPLVAPEVLHHNSRHLHADIYSVGILLLELWFHSLIFFQNDRPNNEFEVRNRTEKLRLTIDDQDEVKNRTEDATLPRTASALQKNKEHNAAMHHFMSKLRMLANVGGTDAEADESSFGTTPTSSATSLTVSLSSSSAIVDKLSKTIEDCLQSDPKKRPTAKKLVDLFQFFLDEINAT
ncbi:TKL protein kinase [Phytophthora nicotianae INRA-310]|uniref:TKL protein kinase n=2 Tax=Phytophthora nicotianae (strain INRA-310) TaxID=761204 RepID=W2RBI4_PHYN3|nr:TKL protein kinase [Phytophthora nicotianae INRA-310]ETN21890.1 TKL protein kinase [Phytophthora nicotianae INRA-310]